MDLKLDISGDLAVDENGLPYYIGGLEEMMQRAYIQMSAVGGGFLYDRELGRDQQNPVIEAALREALKKLPEVEVLSVSQDEDQTMVSLLIEGKECEIRIRGGNTGELQL